MSRKSFFMYFDVYDVWRLLMFVALWRLSHYDVCRLMTFVALWRLSHYDVCRLMTFVALWRLSPYDFCCLMTFVALWRLLPYDFCCIRTFVAYGVSRGALKIYLNYSVKNVAGCKTCENIGFIQPGLARFTTCRWQSFDCAYIIKLIVYYTRTFKLRQYNKLNLIIFKFKKNSFGPTSNITTGQCSTCRILKRKNVNYKVIFILLFIYFMFTTGTISWTLIYFLEFPGPQQRPRKRPLLLPP